MIPVGTAVGYLTLDHSGFTKGLDSAIGKVKGLGGKFTNAISQGLGTAGDKVSKAGLALTAGVTAPMITATKSSVKFGAEFDKQMSNVQAVSNATSEELDAMRDAAMDWGEKTVYTASETADALYYMGLAGWEPQKSIAALGPVLNLAAAGNLDLGRSSDIVTDAMTAMNYEAGKYTDGIENSVYFTNSLAAAMSNSNTDVDQLGEAFKYVSPLAGALNMDINDLSLALGLMANVGVKGTQAGTGLRQALKNLITPTQAAQAAMDTYGISLFDANGKAKNMRTFMEELRGTFGALDVSIYDANGELKTGEQIMEEYGHALPVTQQEQLNAVVEIFGTRALPGILGIINQSDEKFNDLADAIDNSNSAFVLYNGTVYTMADALSKFGEQAINAGNGFEILGAAEGMALMQMDNLQGDWVRFTSAIGTTKIIISDFAKNTLRGLVQKLTELVTWFNNLDESQRKIILTIAAIVAAAGPALFVIGRVLAAIGKFVTVISFVFKALFKVFGLLRIGITLIKTVASSLTAFLAANPIALIIAAVLELAYTFIYLWNHCEAFRQFWINLWNTIKEFAIVTWGVLSEFFVGVWEYIKAAAIFIWDSIATFFVTLWEGIKTTFFTAVNVISTFLSNAWNTIKTVAETIWNAIVGFFSTVWNAIQTTFTTVVNAISTFLSSAWNAISSTTMAVWNAISSFFSSVWTAISTTVTTIVNGIKNTIVTAWNAIKTFITTTVNTIKTTVTNVFNSMWNGIKNTINGIRNTIVTGFNSAVSYIKGLASSAFSWGADIINGIINGIKSAIGGLIDTVSGVASTISSYLHFSVPDVGPLSTFESWMPDFMRGLAQGIEANKYLVKDAITGLATDMIVKPKADVSDMQVSGTPGYGYGQYGIYQNIGNAISELKDVITSGISGDNSDIVIPIYIGNEMLDSIVVKAIDRSNYRKVGGK